MSVYFVTCREANAVKIGSSNDPHARLGEIQWGCPLLLTLEAIIPGDHEVEFELHRRFDDDRIRGEWFRITPIIDAMMANCPSPEAPRKGRVARTPQPRRQRKESPSPSQIYDQRMAIRRLKRGIDAGDIHFPFRELAALEDV